MTNNTKPCGNCGYPLDEVERKGMVEFKGAMYSDKLNENLRVIIEEAHMAGQADAGVDPSYSSAQAVAEAIDNGEDATGLCTVRELALHLIQEEEKRQAKDGIADLYETPLECEMFFELPDGYSVNAEVRVTKVEKV